MLKCASPSLPEWSIRSIINASGNSQSIISKGQGGGQFIFYKTKHLYFIANNFQYGEIVN